MSAIEKFYSEYPFVSSSTLFELADDLSSSDPELAEAVRKIAEGRASEEIMNFLASREDALANALFCYLVIASRVVPAARAVLGSTDVRAAITFFDSSFLVTLHARLERLSKDRKDVAEKAAKFVLASFFGLAERTIPAVQLGQAMGLESIFNALDVLLYRLEPFLKLVNDAEYSARLYDIWASAYALAGDAYNALMKAERAVRYAKICKSEREVERAENNLAVILALLGDRKTAISVLEEMEVISPISELNLAVIEAKNEPNKASERLDMLLKKLERFIGSEKLSEASREVIEDVAFLAREALNKIRSGWPGELFLGYLKGHLVLIPA